MNVEPPNGSDAPPERREREERTGAAVNDYVAMVARHRPYRDTSPRRTIPFRDFRQEVRRHRPSDLLPTLAALALAGGDPPFSAQWLATMPPWAIALAARESILWGNEHRKEGVTGDDLRRLFNAHNDVVGVPRERDDNFVLGMLTQVAYEQFPYQESIFEEVSRTHALLVDGLSAVNLEVLSEKAWEEMLGAPLGQVVGATFFLQVAASKNAGWFDHKWLDRPDMQEIYDVWPREVIERRALELSSTFEEFKAAYHAAPHPPDGNERYSFNPLVERPFVRMNDGRYLAPQPRLILRTITPGALYYRGIRALGEPFARDLGKLTERYVGRQLKSIKPTPDLYPEILYGKPEQASTDWFLVLPSVVVMFEVKSARFGLLERAAAPGFEKRTKSLIDKAVGQLIRSSTEIDARNPAFEHIPSDRPRIGVLVTAEPHYLANSHWTRETVQQAPFPTLTASLRDIELLAALPLDEVERQLVEIANDPDRSTWSLGTAFDRSKKQGPNVVLQEAWDSYPWLEELDIDEDQ